MATYKKRMAEFEAVKWTGDNQQEVFDFMEDAKYDVFINETDKLVIFGRHINRSVAKVGDYIRRSIREGVYYSIPGDYFDSLYEEVNALVV